MKFENIRVMNFENALRGMRNPKESWHLSDSQFGFCQEDKYNDILSECVTKHCEFQEIDIENQYEIYDALCKQMEKSVCIYKDDNLIEYAAIGPKDMELAQKLIRAGGEHRKFLRQIFVSVDITAPLYWWKEADTYKVGTVANSTSTMHKIDSKPITLDCFEIDDYCKDGLHVINDEPIADCSLQNFVNNTIQYLEHLRQKYLETKDKRYWKELIRWLPEGWLQTRTYTLSYETLLAMCSKGQRRSHKLNEWSGIDDESLENFIKMARSLPYASQFLFIDEQ